MSISVDATPASSRPGSPVKLAGTPHVGEFATYVEASQALRRALTAQNTQTVNDRAEREAQPHIEATSAYEEMVAKKRDAEDTDLSASSADLGALRSDL